MTQKEEKKESVAISKEKTILEIKWLKTQRNIAILGMIASILATSIQYSTVIYKHFSKSTLKILLEDEYLARKSIVQITSMGNNQKTHIVAHPKEILEGLNLEAGSYFVRLELRGNPIFEDSIFLKPRQTRVCSIPKFFTGTILVFARINAHKVFPGMMLPVIIDASKDGYLWIYKLKPEEPPQFLFPLDIVDNKIVSSEEFVFPDKKNGVISVGKHVGKEKLLFIVTKKNEKIFADKIALTMSESVIPRGSMPFDEHSYGLMTLSYEIEQ